MTVQILREGEWKDPTSWRRGAVELAKSRAQYAVRQSRYELNKAIEGVWQILFLGVAEWHVECAEKRKRTADEIIDEIFRKEESAARRDRRRQLKAKKLKLLDEEFGIKSMGALSVDGVSTINLWPDHLAYLGPCYP